MIFSRISLTFPNRRYSNDCSVYFFRTLRTSMNALIINLSIADLINCSVCSILMAVAIIGHATHGDVPTSLCHTLDSFHVLGEYAITFGLN